MKKILLFLPLFTFVSFTTTAQIIISTTDVPAPSKWLYYANDTMPSVSMGSASATSQNWDMSGLVQHTLDTSKVMNYSDLPNSVFLTANTVVKQGGGDFFGYLNNSSTSFVLLGGHGTFDVQGSPTTVNQICTPAEIIFNFPSTYTSSFNNNYSTEAKFYYGQQYQGITIDSISQRSYVQKSVLIDAFGTLTTPMGGPYNVLRVNEFKKSNDTIMAYFFGDWNLIPGGIDSTVSTTYYWWANNIGTALITADIDTSGNPSNIQWLKSMPVTPPMSVEELKFSSNSLLLYPNPSTDKISISIYKDLAIYIGKEATVINITNVIGENLKQINVNELLNGDGTIDISDLAKGTYFLQIQNKNLNLNKQFIKE